MKLDFSKISNIPEVSNAFSQNINQNFSFILKKHNLSRSSKVYYLWENHTLNLSLVITDTLLSVFKNKKETYSFKNIYKIDFNPENKEFAIYYSKNYIYEKISGDFFGIDNTISISRYSEIAIVIKDLLNPLFGYFKSEELENKENLLKLNTIETADRIAEINYTHMEVKDIIINEVNNNNINLSNDPQMVFFNQNGVLLNITKDKLFKIREINGLDRNTEILYARYYQIFKQGDFWEASRTIIYSTIFLEDRISIRQIIETNGWDKKPDYVIDISWDEIDEVKVISFYENDEDKESQDSTDYSIRLFSSSDNDILDIPILYFLLDDEKDGLEFANLVNNILLNIKNKHDNNNGHIEKIIEEIREKTNNGDFENALNLIKNNFDLNTIIESNSMIYYFLIYHTSLCLKGLKNITEALKILDERIIKLDTSEGFKEWENSLFELKAEINDELGNHYNSLQNFYFAFQNTQEIESKSNLKEKINSSYNKFKEAFNELQYDKRKMILVHDEIKISSSDAFLILDNSNLPKNIKFPLSHPKKDEIYIGHPYITESYLPFSTYEAYLFNDRFEEFSYFIQCLGAKSMSIKVIKENERNTTDEINSKNEVSLEFGKKIIKNNVNISVDNHQDLEQSEDSKISRVRTQIYNPVRKPYIPENLLWYPHETSWHRLYQQRINGNILKHHDIISSRSNHSISKNEKLNLKIGLKTFFSELNINRDSFIENTINNSEYIEWEVSIEFESIENLNEIYNEVSQDLIMKTSSIEQQYEEEVQFMLEDDDIIDEKERRILNRLRDKLGLSNEKALEIECKVLSTIHLTKNEKEYMEEYQELFNDGEINDKERRILNRYATKLKISPERINQLEIYFRNKKNNS